MTLLPDVADVGLMVEDACSRNSEVPAVVLVPKVPGVWMKMHSRVPCSRPVAVGVSVMVMDAPDGTAPVLVLVKEPEITCGGVVPAGHVDGGDPPAWVTLRS